MSTKTKGDLTEATVLAALLRAGKRVLIPFGENHRYDLVVDEGGQFIRIQCKTGRVKNEAIVFSTCSVHYHRGFKRRHYRGQIDVFGVYVPELDKVYLVPVADGATTACYLRLAPPKNGKKTFRLAATYEILPPK